MGRWQALTRVQKAAAAGGTAAALALVGWSVNWGMPKLIDVINPPAQVSDSARLLIIDTSRSMAGKAGNQKFAMAAAEIESMVNDQPDVAFALRTAGGDCRGGYVDPPVEFAEDNGERIRSALAAARPQGGADIVSQLRQGISDYDRFESVESAQVQSIWLFLASARDCRHGNSSLGKAIKKALAGSLPQLSYVDFYVLRGNPRAIRNLKNSIEPLGTEFSVTFVPTPQRLHEAVEEATETQRPSPSN
jgi:hypothetical protein